MKTTQEIFDLVIDQGFYTTETSMYMCWALDKALRLGDITKEEHCIATKEIEDYLDGWFTFQTALRESGLPRSFQNRLAIYRNWANRPQLITGKE